MWKLKFRLHEFLLKIAQLTSGQEGFQTLISLISKPVYLNCYGDCLKSEGNFRLHSHSNKDQDSPTLGSLLTAQQKCKDTYSCAYRIEGSRELHLHLRTVKGPSEHLESNL